MAQQQTSGHPPYMVTSKTHIYPLSDSHSMQELSLCHGAVTACSCGAHRGRSPGRRANQTKLAPTFRGDRPPDGPKVHVCSEVCGPWLCQHIMELVLPETLGGRGGGGRLIAGYVGRRYVSQIPVQNIN